MIKAPRGAKLHCKGWHQEAAMRMLMNNLIRRWLSVRLIWLFTEAWARRPVIGPAIMR